MPKIKIFSNWTEQEVIDSFKSILDYEFEQSVELYIDRIPSHVSIGTKRILVLWEPPEIADALLPGLEAKVLKNTDMFDYLLTHNQSLLDKLPNKSILFPNAYTWIKNYDFPKKKFSISTLVGGKLMAPGHYLRHKVWFSQNSIKNPTEFFLSGNFGNIENINNNPILGADKNPLFNSEFHICIENAKRNNWFTEKIIDCFQTKTIPIYWGCPNIGDWFDPDGVIAVDNIDDIINVCNSLDEKTYFSKISSIEKNFELSKNFVSISDRLIEKIKELAK